MKPGAIMGRNRKNMNFKNDSNARNNILVRQYLDAYPFHHFK